MSLSRRDLLGFAGRAAVFGGVLPAFSGCGKQLVRNSLFVPTPEDPLTPNADFYINYCCGLPPPERREELRLTIDGLVDRELRLSFDDLRSFPEITAAYTLECIGNSPEGGLISSAAFTGVRLKDVLSAAGVSNSARGLFFLGRDDYPSFLPVDAGTKDESILVYSTNGVPLTEEHGAPLRVLFPGRYGMKCVKWLKSITAVRNFHSYGAFRGLELSFDGKTVVRSQFSHTFAEVERNRPLELSGIALTPGVGVERVEVDAGDGFSSAEIVFNTLEDAHSPYLWTIWKKIWIPERTGIVDLSVRAFDRLGRTQEKTPKFPYDTGAIHTFRARVL